jgi:hypothetical protein
VIRVTFQATGYESFSYETIYEDTTDPTSGQAFLNVRLRAAPQ